MLLRLIVENIASFKDATEFNMFPSSKSQNHNNHKIKCGHATVLRMSALYGANGAGKSNLVNALRLLQDMVKEESLEKIEMFDVAFMLDNEYKEKTSGLAIEFYNKRVYYYHIEFFGGKIITEELYVSHKNRDAMLFSRNGSNLSINATFDGKKINEQFKDALRRLVRPDMLLLSLLGNHYSDESPIITDAYQWITNKLQMVNPYSKFAKLPHLLDTDSKLRSLVSSVLPELKTGIVNLGVRKNTLKEEHIKDDELLKVLKRAKENPNVIISIPINGAIANVINENGKIVLKQLVAMHKNLNGTVVPFQISNESDGTRRLIEYMPLLYDIIYKGKIYVVDEIERSLHPIMIKDIIRKISESENAKGQLIFTTHESCLLDQNIFRPDEIWFAQKDVEQATQLYPLSDFNIHKTANIENGYLDGRYGGIPFLSNLKDLNW